MNFNNSSLMMLHIIRRALNSRIWRDRRGQDLIEYALMAGFVAVAAGAIMPGVASSINVIFSQVNSIMVASAAS
jgi:Flp pilus assembly pilin Flp